jgi:hypothetical protein
MDKKSYLILLFAAIVMVGCGKYRKYDNMEVVESTFSGAVTITSSGTTPAGDFEGNGDSGVYSFAYDNPKEKAQVNFDVTSPAGSVQMIIKDAKGKEVLNETRNGGGNDTFAGPTTEGKKGVWLVEIILTNVDGDGSFSINPID